MITAIARSKVNLYLHVTGKRADGYHLLESLVVFPDLGDSITIQKGKELSLEVAGPYANSIGNTEENLVLKAAKLLKSESRTDEGAHIILEKNLPAAAGIGGGSADAAAALRNLNQLWNIGYSDDQLSRIGLVLGADVPACLYGKPAIMAGIGERISGIREFPEFCILLVNSGHSVSTQEVFNRLKLARDVPPSVEFTGATTRDLFAGLTSMRNDLEVPALEFVPVIGDVLSAIRKQKECYLARMSGSGGTCFGLFEDNEAAEKAAHALRARHPDWWVQAVAVGR